MEVGMQSRQEGLTVDEIINHLREDGFQITKRTFQYYVQSGILPKGVRKGAKSGGVRFYYPPSVLENLRQIFILKSKGYKLSEIKKRISAPQGEGGGPMPSREPLVAMPSFDLPADDQKSEEDPSITKSLSGPGLYEQVIRLTPDGETLRLCLQCGTCGGSCPSAVDMDYTPRQLTTRSWPAIPPGTASPVITARSAARSIFPLRKSCTLSNIWPLKPASRGSPMSLISQVSM
jgi:DNA-binding transcriptional MerR regulator